MKFTKFHGAGNDFILIDARALPYMDWPAIAIRMCDRHFGIGADGIILALHSQQSALRMRILNPDGSEAEMCGNGIRCLAKYAIEEHLVAPANNRLEIETVAGILTTEVFGGESIERVRVDMGAPRFEPRDLPMAIEAKGPVVDFPLQANGASIPITCVSMGNPHAVFFQEEPVQAYPLETIGPLVEHHPLFPQRVNYEVARVLSRRRIELRVWERGAGQTLACGTGACAVAVAARLKGLIDDSVEVLLPGGTLSIEWPGHGQVFLTGPAERVFAGEWPVS